MRSQYLLVNLGGSHSQIVKIPGITIGIIHAATWWDAMLQKVRAGAPVGVILHATAAQLITGKKKEPKFGNLRHMVYSFNFKKKLGPNP